MILGEPTRPNTGFTPETLGFSSHGQALRKEIRGVGYEIAPLSTIGELDEAVKLQQEVWQLSDKDVCPSHMWVTAIDTGGHVLGTRDEEGKLVAFIAGFGGFDSRDNHPFVVSDMAAVSPAFRDSGLGYNLKLAQALHVMRQGVSEIRWTYDPLRSKNARLNLGKLGAVATGFYIDKYGGSLQGDQNTDITDRFLVKWDIEDPSVQGVLVNGKPAINLDGIPTAEIEDMPDASAVAIRIPYDIDQLPEAERRAEQLRFRALASVYIGERGYRGVDYVVQEAGEERSGFYILNP